MWRSYQWVKAFGDQVEQVKRPADQIVEINEWHSYVGHKNYGRVWLAVDRLGKRFLHVVIGFREAVIGVRLGAAIKSPLIQRAMTDYWAPDKQFIPPQTHVQSQADTFTIEGYSSLLRHFLARLRRKTTCYSKSETMLWYAVRFVMAKWNGELKYILN